MKHLFTRRRFLAGAGAALTAANAAMIAGSRALPWRRGGFRAAHAYSGPTNPYEGLKMPENMVLSQDGKGTVGFKDTEKLPWAPEWHKHDPDRPWPPIVTPGEPCCPDDPAFGPPEDAIVLFGGTDTDMWEPNEWIIEDGELVANEHNLVTRDPYGDCQLHVEWSVPDPPSAERPGNQGNSGVRLMSRYEIQIYDTYNLRSYPDGIAGAVYGETPPMVHPMRPPGQWNEFDIFFTAPVFDGDEVAKPGTLTLLFNGMLAHYNTVIHGAVSYRSIASYQPHEPKEPFFLEYHGNPVRFRNIWIRPMDDLWEHVPPVA